MLNNYQVRIELILKYCGSLDKNSRSAEHPVAVSRSKNATGLF